MGLFEPWPHNFSKAVEVLFLFFRGWGRGEEERERRGEQGGDKICFLYTSEFEGSNK